MATVKRVHDESPDHLGVHLADVMAAYGFARRLRTLGGLTPHEYIAGIWISEPDRFIVNAIHQMPGLNTLVSSQGFKRAEQHPYDIVVKFGIIKPFINQCIIAASLGVMRCLVFVHVVVLFFSEAHIAGDFLKMAHDPLHACG